jgi:hypothetical protein
VGDRSLSPTPPWQVSGLILGDTRLRSFVSRCGRVRNHPNLWTGGMVGMTLRVPGPWRKPVLGVASTDILMMRRGTLPRALSMTMPRALSCYPWVLRMILGLGLLFGEGFDF